MKNKKNKTRCLYYILSLHLTVALKQRWAEFYKTANKLKCLKNTTQQLLYYLRQTGMSEKCVAFSCCRLKGIRAPHRLTLKGETAGEKHGNGS